VLARNGNLVRTDPEDDERRVEFDALDERNSFPDDSFDYVVLAHCS